MNGCFRNMCEYHKIFEHLKTALDVISEDTLSAKSAPEPASIADFRWCHGGERYYRLIGAGR